MSGQNDFKTYLQTTAVEIEKELKKIADDWNTRNKTTFSEINALSTRFTNSWLGGKMLRGTLVKLGFELVSSTQADAIFKPAAAFEILHTALLIHDDIIDQSPTRRGKPALHIHKNPHYGIAQAICLGDLGISLSGKLIAESDFPEKRKIPALRYFYEMVNTTILGEMMDVASASETKQTEEEILEIQIKKTANYTITGPLTLGAILAGASNEFLEKIKLYAQPLGTAYQIQDDILGVFGNEKDLGKSTISDIEENKNTLLIAYALKHANKQELKRLKNIYGKNEITKKQLETIKKIFIESGSLSYSQNKINDLTTQAKKIIPQLSKDKKKQVILIELADVLVARRK